MMKRFTAILSIMLISLSAFAQVNFWKEGHFESIEKEKIDSLTFGHSKDYCHIADFQSIYKYRLTIQEVYELQKAIYEGLGLLNYHRHNDFGYASICMTKESFGQDFISKSDYNWFCFSDYNNHQEATLNTTFGLQDHLIWNILIKTLIMSDHIIEISADQYEVAQARAMRAHAYMNLAELYQFAYDESTATQLPCMPLVLDSATLFKNGGMPRATVAEVYAQIKKDLDAAVDGLKGFERSDKSAVDQAVAYGLRARANLLTHNFEQAASDAMQALTLSGATPLSREEAGVPGFADAAAKNVIWANIIDEADDAVQTAICNWVSHMSTFYKDGYTSVGATRWIASNLYDEIPETDVRKGWWLNANRQSPLLDAEGYSYLKETILGNSSYYPAYTNVKFGTGDGSVSGLGAAAGDWILMRAEEMMLVYAEALQRQGKDGASVLADFVRTYRDPSYELSAHGLSVLDEIWWQRRVELWGEGFSFGDLMRLKKGVTRTNATNWPDAWKQDISADDKKLLLAIPQTETPIRMMFAWHKQEDMQNPYTRTFTQTDSITFGEPKEFTNIYFQEKEYQETMTMEQVAEPHIIKIVLQRSHNIQEDVSFDLEIVSASEIFSDLKPTVKFQHGHQSTDKTEKYTTSELQIVIPAITNLGTFSFTLRIPDRYSPYGNIDYKGKDDWHGRTFTYTITAYEDPWKNVPIKKGVMIDYSISELFKIPTYPFYVNYKFIQNDGGTSRIRILNPFYVIATDDNVADENGIYPFYPRNEFTKLLEVGNYDIDITIDEIGRATVSDFALGIECDYGAIEIKNYFSPAEWSGRLDDKVVFDKNSLKLAIYMGGKAYGYAGFTFYFNLRDFQMDQPVDPPVHPTADSYTGKWRIKLTDAYTGNEADDVVISVENGENENGQFYTIKGLHADAPEIYGHFDPELYTFVLEESEGAIVERNGKTCQAYLSYLSHNGELASSLSLTLVNDSTLDIHETSKAKGFLIIYDDVSDIGDIFEIVSISRADEANNQKKQLPAAVIKPLISDTPKLKLQTIEL